MVDIMSVNMEVSAQLATASLLGLPAQVITEQFTYFFINLAVKYSFSEVGVVATVVTAGK